MKNFMLQFGQAVSNALCNESAGAIDIDSVDADITATDDTAVLIAHKYSPESSTEYTITITRKVNRYSDD